MKTWILDSISAPKSPSILHAGPLIGCKKLEVGTNDHNTNNQVKSSHFLLHIMSKYMKWNKISWQIRVKRIPTLELVWVLNKLSRYFTVRWKTVTFLCLCYSSMQSDSPGNQDWTVFSASRVFKWLPGGLSTPDTQSGIYNEIMGLPFDPRGCV